MPERAWIGKEAERERERERERESERERGSQTKSMVYCK
jgi:hypothetical protein